MSAVVLDERVDAGEVARLIGCVTDACRAGELDASPTWIRLADGARIAFATMASQRLTSETSVPVTPNPAS